MSVRSALGFDGGIPIGNQDLYSVLVAGNNANNKDILSVGNLECHTINGETTGSGGLSDVLKISDDGGGLNIFDVDEITCNKLTELGRSKYFEYIVTETFINVLSAAPFQLDISGGTITLEEGSYMFNFTINLSANLAVNSYTIQLFLDATIIAQTTARGDVYAPYTDLTTLIINSLPVTRVSPAAGVVTLKCIVNAPVYGMDVTLQGFPTNQFSYLSWVEVYSGPDPPPIGFPLTITGVGAGQVVQTNNEFIYYMTNLGSSVLTPNYSFIIDEIFIVGAGQNGQQNTNIGSVAGGNGGGVLLYSTPTNVTTANTFDVVVGQSQGISSVISASLAINLLSSAGTIAAGGSNNNNGTNGTQYVTTGYTYGGGGAGGSSVEGSNGKNGGAGGGGGGGSFTYSTGESGGNGGGNGVDAGGLGGTSGGAGQTSQYGGGGGDGYAPYTGNNGGVGGNGGTNGGLGGGGYDNLGGGGGGGGNYGGGGGGGGANSGFLGSPGFGGAGIVIIKITV